MKLFISYRRSDSEHFAGRLAERLKPVRGITGLFFDIDSIAVGEDFVRRINAALDQCAAVLVLIGAHWLDGGRLFDEKDFVRLEIRAALTRESRVVPVLLDDARMPAPDALPQDLRALTRLNAVQVRHSAFDRDVRHLIDAVLQRKPPGQIGAFLREHPLLATIVDAVVGAVSALLLLMLALAIAGAFRAPSLGEMLEFGDQAAGTGRAIVVIVIVVLLGAGAPWFLRRRGVLR